MVTFILLAPLAAALLAGFGHRWIGEKMAMMIPTGILIACALAS